MEGANESKRDMDERGIRPRRLDRNDDKRDRVPRSVVGEYLFNSPFERLSTDAHSVDSSRRVSALYSASRRRGH